MDETSTAVLERHPFSYEPTPKELELEHNETSRLQRIKGSPRVWYVEIKNDGSGIFKSRFYKEKIISDTQNERAAYIISRILGLNFVPTTVLRTVDGQEGALQEFIEDAEFIYEVEQTPRIKDGLYKFWIFGHIIRNMDRHDDNLLIKEGQVLSIDHEGSFDPDFQNSSDFDDFRHYYGEQAPGDLVEIFKEFKEDGTRQEALRSTLQGLIESEDIEITMRRIEGVGRILIEKGRIDSKEELAIS